MGLLMREAYVRELKCAFFEMASVQINNVTGSSFSAIYTDK